MAEIVNLSDRRPKANLSGMRWADVDLGAGAWHIPPASSENKKPISVPLIEEALEILKRRKTEAAAPFIFPSPTSKTGHVVEPRKPFQRACKRAGIEGLRIHDLRRTVGSRLAARGASGFIIQKALGHRNAASVQVYAHLDQDPVREAMHDTMGGLKGEKRYRRLSLADAVDWPSLEDGLKEIGLPTTESLMAALRAAVSMAKARVSFGQKGKSDRYMCLCILAMDVSRALVAEGVAPTTWSQKDLHLQSRYFALVQAAAKAADIKPPKNLKRVSALAQTWGPFIGL